MENKQKNTYPTALFQKNYKKHLQAPRALAKMRPSQVVAMEKFLST